MNSNYLNDYLAFGYWLLAVGRYAKLFTVETITKKNEYNTSLIQSKFYQFYAELIANS